MKRIYMAAALIGTLATGAYAQKSLKIQLLKPTANQVFTNTPDSIYYQFSITNNGPDAVDPTQGDTLSIMMDIQYFGCVLQNIKWLKNDAAISIASGQTRTINFTTKVGDQFWSDPAAPKVSVTPDSKWCPKVAVFGVHTDGTSGDATFFAGNPGVDPAAINNAFSTATTQAQLGDLLMLGLSGDALSTVTGVTFGSGAADKCNPTGIIEFNGGTKEALEIYPNPTSDNLNFDLSFAKSANATVRVADISGRTVMTQELGKVQAGAHKFAINVSALKAGMYLIEVSSDGGRYINKFNKK